MSSSIAPLKSVGCFQSVVNFHNEGILKLAESCACITRLEIKNDGGDADGFLKKIGKMFALIVLAVPLFLFHFARTLFNKVTDCCGKKIEASKAPDTDKASSIDALPSGNSQAANASSVNASTGDNDQPATGPSTPSRAPTEELPAS